MEEIQELFVSLINQHGSLDIAEAEFRRMLVDEPDMKRRYREYCRLVGSSERNGFKDFCDEYMEGQDEVWGSLRDPDGI